MDANEKINSEIEAVLDAASVGRLRIVGLRQNVSDLVCKDVEEAYKAVRSALDAKLLGIKGGSVEVVGLTETKQEVLVCINPADVSLIFKFPKPSALQLVRPSIGADGKVVGLPKPS